MKRWTLAWISLECTILSVANHINKAKGAARGRAAQSQQNRGNATQARLEQEAEDLSDCQRGVRTMLRILEDNPTLPFAYENPDTSDMWELPMVKEALRRNPTWRVVRVDQCAYGRKSQKPTKILTNLTEWQPRGCTGNGRCKIGACAGTVGNPPGDRRHVEQTVPNSKDRRPDQGAMVNGKREYLIKTVKNAVASGLVLEILHAARTTREQNAKATR